jgi:hypothetical protein
MSASPRSATLRQAGDSATGVAQPCESPQREPALEEERILMVDFASTHDWAKEAAASTNRERGQTKAATAEPINTSSPSTTDEVDRLYRQLAEIHAIAASQLVKCAR